jgi:hypothetical protein
MNERIKELYGNALDKAVPYTWHNLDHVEVEKIMKVFAELIVQDCLFIIDDERKSEMVSRIELWKQVKQHFGVDK